MQPCDTGSVVQQGMSTQGNKPVAVQVTPEQSLALVEYIAHLSVEDWDGIARDLRKLGFVPAGMPPLHPRTALAGQGF